MKILVFEWLVSGEAGAPAPPANSPMLQQGAAMFAAVVADAIHCGAEVIAPVAPHVRPVIEAPHLLGGLEFPEGTRAVELVTVEKDRTLRSLLLSLAPDVDWIMVIAPESEGILEQCIDWLQPLSAKLICGPAELIRRFANKNTTQDFLKQHGINVPAGHALTRPCPGLPRNPNLRSALGFPVVIKPAHGAGADDVFLCHDDVAVQTLLASPQLQHGHWRIEEYMAGVSVSVTMVRNDTQTLILPPTGQQFSNSASADGIQGQPEDHTAANPTAPPTLQAHGHYCGTQFPLPAVLADRATGLANQVADTIPQWRGFLGIDMVLGADGEDYVIEINPRMTMSYTHLRKSISVNFMKFFLGQN